MKHNSPSEDLNALMPIEHAQAFAHDQSITSAEAKTILEELNRAFEQFKLTNDERLENIERRTSVDGVTVDKLGKLEHVITGLSQDLKRPLQSKADTGFVANQQNPAFETFLKTGEARDVQSFETKSLSAGSDTDGGYMVPENLDTNITSELKTVSALRTVATIVQISGGGAYRKLHQNGEMGASWVSETAERDVTDTSQFKELQVPVHELHACPAATAALMSDSAINIEGWFLKAINMSFGEKESDAFINGNGTNQPKGILDYTHDVDGTGDWNKLAVIKSGDATGLPSADEEGKLIDLVYGLGTHYRQNAHWIMNQSTMSEVRKLKTSDKSYIWTPPGSIDQLPSVLGFPILEVSDMPTIEANAIPILFGDFKSGYVIVEKNGTQILRDPFSKKPYVLFYTIRRVGGGIQDFAAIRGLKIAA